MNTYEKSGYLKEDFKYFHLHTRKMQEFQYHYHDFHKVLLFLAGRRFLSYRRKSFSSVSGRCGADSCRRNS